MNSVIPVKDTDSLCVNVEGFGLQTVLANKVVAVLKARNAAGLGCRIAYSFTGRELRFVELGRVADE